MWLWTTKRRDDFGRMIGTIGGGEAGGGTRTPADVISEGDLTRNV